MREARLAKLMPGAILARPLHSERGDILLQPGVILTRKLIDALKARGFLTVSVRDGIADDIVPPELVSQHVRNAVADHMTKLLSLARRGDADGEQGSSLARLAAAVGPVVADLYRDVQKIVEEALTADALGGVASLKSYDNYTFEHSVEVAVIAVMLGRRVYLSRDELHEIALGGLLHDLGKLLLPREILNKAAPLTAEEWAAMKKHPETGYEMAKGVSSELAVIARHVVWQHHERQDGTGYPRGLKGNNELRRPGLRRFQPGFIVFAAEIASVADVYSALASDRPYRLALDHLTIAQTMQKSVGTQLNGSLVKQFLEILPLHPIGSRVELTTGNLCGCRGVVIAVNPREVNRPTVRVLFGPGGEEITPFEVDLNKTRGVQITSETTDKHR